MNVMKLFTVPAECIKIETMHNNILRIKMDTMELSNTEKATVMGWHGMTGVMAFKPATAFTDDELAELPDIVKKPTGKKSPSDRLHGVLALIAMAQGKEVSAFYASEMERIIEHYRRKLREIEEQKLEEER